jgi:hypothetical protein
MYKIESYNPNGIPNLFGYSEKKTKIIIDPSHDYFFNSLKYDRDNFDNLILINGCEPLVFTNLTQIIINNQKFFNKIYSSDEIVLKNCSNSELFCYGSCWVLTDVNNEKIDLENGYFNNFKIEDKKFKLSFIRSGKRQLNGHIFRHSIDNIINKKYEFDFLFPKNRIDTKIELFTNSMFHLVIENCQQKNYFTEKLIDCFMSFTIPIYWGCPNIDDFFDKNGIIVVNNQTELKNVLETLKEEDFTKRIHAMKKNYEICMNKKYPFFFERVTELCKN